MSNTFWGKATVTLRRCDKRQQVVMNNVEGLCDGQTDTRKIARDLCSHQSLLFRAETRPTEIR